MLKKIFFWNQNNHLISKKNIGEIVIQAFVVGISALILISMFSNYIQNTSARNIELGFGFLDDTAGYHIGQTLIPYSQSDSYLKVYLVGILNTVLASIIAIILATIVGLVVGITSLSSNWLLRKLCSAYIEVLRNFPPLLHVLFWYIVVILKLLPDYKNSLNIFNVFYLNVRGFTMPALQSNPRTLIFLILLVIVIGLRVWLFFHRRFMKREGNTMKINITGTHWHSIFLGVLIVVLIILRPFNIVLPVQGKFSFTSGFTVYPELFAIVVALAIYTSTFIAVIVSSAIRSIPVTQIESAHSLGLSYIQRLQYVVIPLALRSMIPPLTNQYLNILKNSSLGVAIGYPELVAVFAGTALNQSGRAIEIMAMVMGTYLFFSITISICMNIYNKKVVNK